MLLISEGHLMARPEELEEDAVKRAIALAKKSNVPIVICGPTSKEALAVISEERAKGQVSRTLLRPVLSYCDRIFIYIILYL